MSFLATRNAIRILQQNEYPDEIIDEARRLSKSFHEKNPDSYLEKNLSDKK